MINYFEYYNLPEKWNIDRSALRKLFYENSRKYHPDFFTLDSTMQQEEALQLSMINNEAYKLLTDDDARLKHLLEIKGAIKDTDKESLSPIFLMEMMDINEAIMDAEMGDMSTARYEELVKNVATLEEEIINEIALAGDNPNLTESELTQLKDCYYKKKYISRLKENIKKLQTV